MERKWVSNKTLVGKRKTEKRSKMGAESCSKSSLFNIQGCCGIVSRHYIETARIIFWKRTFSTIFCSKKIPKKQKRHYIEATLFRIYVHNFPEHSIFSLAEAKKRGISQNFPRNATISKRHYFETVCIIFRKTRFSLWLKRKEVIFPKIFLETTLFRSDTKSKLRA